MDLRALLLRVTIDGEEVVTHALGESMTGVPATPDMHIRNGAVAITYVSVLLLTLVDDGTVTLDDTIDRWLPDLPDAGRVTLRMLADMTAGYPDFVPNPEFVDAFVRDPFRAWTPEELIDYGISQPRRFAPGENWDYAHTNYVILGLALEAITGQPLADLLRERVLDPLGLTGTGSEQTAWMPQPVLHGFSSERREFFGISAATPFYEESTFWNPSWTLPRGAVQYSTVTDMAASFAAIGRGDLLSEASYQELVTQRLLGFGAPLDGCPACHTMDRTYLYGLGIITSGSWLMQNPLFGGYASTAACHPGAGIAIAAATTFTEAGYDDTGSYRFGKSGTTIVHDVAALLLPDDPPLLK
jgi:CubicO group peptidase (beta-lactamase class C family)